MCTEKSDWQLVCQSITRRSKKIETLLAVTNLIEIFIVLFEICIWSIIMAVNVTNYPADNKFPYLRPHRMNFECIILRPGILYPEMITTLYSNVIGIHMSDTSVTVYSC